jgi:hypothetical protein
MDAQNSLNVRSSRQFMVECPDWDIKKVASTFIDIFFDIFNQHRFLDRTKNEDEIRIMHELIRDGTAICGFEFFKMRMWGLEPCVVFDSSGEIICVIKSYPMLGVRGIKRLDDKEKACIGKYCQYVSSTTNGIKAVEVDTSNKANFWKSDYCPYWFALQFSQNSFVRSQTKQVSSAKLITCKKTIGGMRELWNRERKVFFQKNPPWDGYGIWGSFKKRKFNSEVSYQFIDFCDLFFEKKDVPYVFAHRLFPRGLFSVLE